MVFRVFSVIIFYLEPTVRKDAWMRTTSVTVMIIFFKKWNSQIYLITAIFKVPSQQLRGTLTTDTLQSFILQTWINMLAKSFIKTSVNATETKIDESVWQLRKNPSVHLEVQFLSNLVFRSNIVLIGIFLHNFQHNLLSFLPFD